MVRRGLKCNLEALAERPELREFQQRWKSQLLIAACTLPPH
jgi:hypothetical protein